MNWSPQQDKIFTWFAAPTPGNLVVRARAGTGKTTTIIEAISRAPESMILLAAFNKRIAVELQSRLTHPGAEAKTLHSVGFGLVMRNWGRVNVDGDRGDRLSRAACGGDRAPEPIVRVVAKLAALTKNMMPLADDPEQVMGIAVEFDCLPDSDFVGEGWTDERVVSCALAARKAALTRDGSIDFDDMLFVPVAHGWVRGRYDLVCVDEAQDMNAAQVEIARRIVRLGGRVVVVGDDRQAIYRFRGADCGSIDRLKAELEAVELPLTVTYRCGKAIVAETQRIVPDFEAGPLNGPGEVKGIVFSALAKAVQPGDFVLSRKNAPLVRTCLSILRLGKRAKVEGRDIGKGMVTLVGKLKARSIPDFIGKTTVWEQKSAGRYRAMGKKGEAKLAELVDQAETLRVLAAGMAGVRELIARIEDLFADGAAGVKGLVVCSSIHKAKGLEADTVYVLWDTLNAKASKVGEEANLEYVAVTRARNVLVKVEGLPGED